MKKQSYANAAFGQVINLGVYLYLIYHLMQYHINDGFLHGWFIFGAIASAVLLAYYLIMADNR